MHCISLKNDTCGMKMILFWCNLQAKLHSSASAEVPSVSEKQPPPEEVWSQKVILFCFMCYFILVFIVFNIFCNVF